MKRILFKTTIPRTDDDWHIGRFSLLLQQVESLRDSRGAQVFSVAARDRTVDADGNDPDLFNLRIPTSMSCGSSRWMSARD